MTNEERRQLEVFASRMAVDINGGSWDKDYTEAQKQGWRLKFIWACNNVDTIDVVASSYYGEKL